MTEPLFFKSAKSLTIAEIAALTGAEAGPQAPPGRRISSVAPLDTATPRDLAFLVDGRRVVFDEHFRLTQRGDIEVRQHVAQMLLRERRAGRAERGAEHRAGLVAPRLAWNGCTRA